jgi:hypothetical protein
MKKLPFILTVAINIFFCVNGIAALQSDSIPLDNSTAYNYYLKKSMNQKKLSTILSISGGVIAGVGMTLAVSQLSAFMKPGSKTHDYGSIPDILGPGGLALIVAAVPIALESRKNKKRSQLYLQPQVSEIKGITQKSIAYTGLEIGLKF